MREEIASIGGVGIFVRIPETKEELNRGCSGIALGENEGILFDVAPFVRNDIKDDPEFEGRLWIPVVCGREAPDLDVLWIENGEVTACCTHRGGQLQGYGSHVLEMPSGWAERHGVGVGARLVIGKDIHGQA